MAKKQTFGDKALQLKQSQRKMAKVILAKKSDKGTFGYREAIVDNETVKDFIAKNR